MKTKPVPGHEDIDRMLAAARAEALSNQWAVTIAIVDDGGHLLALQRLDGASPVSAQIAVEKARTAALGRRPSQAYEEMINGGRVSFLSAGTGRFDGSASGLTTTSQHGLNEFAIGVRHSF